MGGANGQPVRSQRARCARHGFHPVDGAIHVRDHLTRTTIAGLVALPDGSTAVACLNGTELAYATTVDHKVAAGKFTLNLKDPLHQGNSVDILITSADGKTRIKVSTLIAPVKFTAGQASSPFVKCYFVAGLEKGEFTLPQGDKPACLAG